MIIRALIIIMLVMCGAANATNYCDSALGCWLFTDTDYNGGSGTTVDDASPNSNTGTFKGDGEPAWNTDNVSFGESGSAPNSVVFDDTNDYISLGSDSTLDNIGDMSIALWFYRTATNAFDAVFVKLNSNTWPSGTMIYFGSVSPFTSYYLHFDRRYVGTCYNRTASSIENNAWHHYVATKLSSGSSVASYYVDGVSVSSTFDNPSSGALLDDSGATAYIGNNGTSNTYPAGGRFSDYGLFELILDSTDVSAIYDYGLTGQTGGGAIIRNSTIRNSIIR